MGLREIANQKKGLTTAIAIAMVVVAVGVLAWQITGGFTQAADQAQSFFSDDDGKTFFAADASKLPPFDHNGKEAVKAHVYTCDDGKTTFVGYLERYTPEATAKLNAARNTDKYDQVVEEVFVNGTELKKPGDAKWSPRSSPEGRAAAMPKCPDGSGTIKLVF